jgi:hypothetical protein
MVTIIFFWLVYLRVRPAEFVVFGRPEELGAGLDLRAYGGQLVVSREQGPAGGQLSALHVSSSAKLRQDIKVFLFFREKKTDSKKQADSARNLWPGGDAAEIMTPACLSRRWHRKKCPTDRESVH